MVPTTPRGASDTPGAQVGDTGGADDRSRDENRQPEMSQPVRVTKSKSQEPIFWLVPDTRDDIVVSRVSDF